MMDGGILITRNHIQQTYEKNLIRSSKINLKNNNRKSYSPHSRKGFPLEMEEKNKKVNPCQKIGFQRKLPYLDFITFLT